MSMDIDQHSPSNSPTPHRAKSLKRKHANGPPSSKKKRVKKSQPDLSDLHAQLPNGHSLPLTPEQSQLSDQPLNGPSEEPNTSQVLDAYDAAHQAASGLLSTSKPPASPFFRKRISLYVSLPPISISQSSGVSSLIALHLTPLLLTYYSPLEGVILSFDNVAVSEEPVSDKFYTESSASCHEEKAVSFLWLTATFLVLSPQAGDILDGTLTVTSARFIGLSLYNYFPISIGGDRIPKSWIWHPPPGSEGRKQKKKPRSIRLKSSSPCAPNTNDENKETGLSSSSKEETTSDSDTTVRATPTPPQSPTSCTKSTTDSALSNQGYFTYTMPSSSEPIPVPDTLRFRVLDTIINPGVSAGTFSLQIEGSLLSDQEEEQAVEEDWKRWERREAARLEKMHGPKRQENAAEMSGALGGKSRSRSRSRRISSDGERYDADTD